MDHIIFPEDENTFLENVKVSFTTDLKNGCLIFYQMYVKLKSIEKENQILKDNNTKLLQYFESLRLNLKATKNAQEKLVREMIQREDDLVKEIEIISKFNTANNIPCLNNLLLTINSVILFQEELSNKYNIDYVLTKKLNQDSLEIFFFNDKISYKRRKQS